MKNQETGHEIIMSQFNLMQTYGRRGDIANARVCLDSAKSIWCELADVDETVKVNLDFYKKNYVHFDKMIG